MNVNIPDILMAVGSVAFITSVASQIIKVKKAKSTKDISWVFLCFLMLSIILFITGKILLGCYNAAIMDGISLGGYFILAHQKFYYDVIKHI